MRLLGSPSLILGTCALLAASAPSSAFAPRSIPNPPLVPPRSKNVDGGRGALAPTTTTTTTLSVRGGAGNSALKAEASAAAASSDGGGGEKQTLTQATVNLIKACAGAGMLSLPAGVAAMGDSPKALLPASILLLILGSISAYSFFMLGRLSHHNSDASDRAPTSFGDAWETEVGPKSAWVVVLSCLLTPYGAALAYTIMLGDMLSSLASTAGLKGLLATRHASILALMSLVIYPLCNLKSMASLAPISAVGVAGIFLTCAFMAVRCIGGSYLPGGAFHETVAATLRPSFDVAGFGGVLSPSALVLCGMAATAYLVHFSAYDFYNGLEDNNLKRFGMLSVLGFAGTALVSVLMMSLGFLTFGGNAAGLILNNYSTADAGATLCRLLTAVGLIGSYPIFFRGIKSAFLDLFYRNEEVSPSRDKKVTLGLLGSLTGLGLLLENAGFMVSFTGAVAGSAIIYIFPPVMYLKSTARRIANGSMVKSKRVKLERAVSRALIGLGVAMGVAGGTVTVLDAFFPHLL